MENAVPRVAVTASVEASAGMSAELVAVGLRPVALPCVRIQQADEAGLARARAAVEEADLVVLTSSRALDVMWPQGPVPDTPIAMLTPAGAARVEERGARVVHIGTGNPADFTAYLARKAAGKRVAYPHDEGVDPRIIVSTADAAAELVAVAVYGWVPLAPAAHPVEAAVFESSPAVEGWMEARDLVGIVAAAIGPATAAALCRYGHGPDIMVRRPRFEILAETLASALLTS
ncbi:MAG: uroporphyrinogen-III synthase [Acidimicrobiia bacterium]|nr:uroporphyrinogen-III synthase [Acidimicrobiia bacterium]